MDSLQIYAQSGPHDRAFICGTKKYMLALREAIDCLLEYEWTSISHQTNTSDGEGYTVRIMLMEENEFDEVGLPYTSDIFSDQEFKNKKHPWAYDTEKNPPTTYLKR
jgi:hypothetical protein